MAVDKLKEGIDGFAKDQVKLEAMIHDIVEGERVCPVSPQYVAIQTFDHLDTEDVIICRGSMAC